MSWAVHVTIRYPGISSSSVLGCWSIFISILPLGVQETWGLTDLPRKLLAQVVGRPHDIVAQAGFASPGQKSLRIGRGWLRQFGKGLRLGTPRCRICKSLNESFIEYVYVLVGLQMIRMHSMPCQQLFSTIQRLWISEGFPGLKGIVRWRSDSFALKTVCSVASLLSSPTVHTVRCFAWLMHLLSQVNFTRFHTNCDD